MATVVSQVVTKGLLDDSYSILGVLFSVTSWLLSKEVVEMFLTGCYSNFGGS